MLKKGVSITIFLGLFSAGFIAGCAQEKTIKTVHSIKAEAAVALPGNIHSPNIVNGAGTIEVAFSPSGGATETVVQAINEARKSIRVQAYSFTSTPIAKALVDAQKRGVAVRVILDKSQETEKYSSAKFFLNNNIETKIDHDFQIAHNKVMIIDDLNVVTGSFNFTKSAEQNNAENVLVLRGNQALADLYIENWEWRWNETQIYK